MAIRPDGTAKRQLRTLFHLGTTGHLTDGQLLERFATRSGSARELAFAALVDRHGPLVLRVCRTVLRDEHDAQDAFQATFIVLVRKGKSLWVRESIGPWLHAVALRAARGARASRERRRAREEGVIMPEHEPTSLPAADPDGLGRALHEEIERLPARFRTPIILCDLEGLTHEQASQAIGRPVGTIKSRLSRGRSLLRDRLTRRGLAPVVGIGASLITTGTRASVPGMLANATIELATHSAAGTLTGALVPAAVAGIAGGVSHAMMFAKLKLIAVPVLAVGVAAGVGIRAQDDGPGELVGGVMTGENPVQDDDGMLLYRLHTGPLPETEKARGNLEANRVTQMQSRIEGETSIVWIVPEGTRVKEDQPVCELDSSALRDRLAAQELVARKSMAELAASEHVLKVAELELEAYLTRIHPQEVESIAQSIDQAESEVERAKDRRSWSETMFDLGYITNDQFKKDEENVNTAKFKLAELRTKPELLENYTKPKTVKTLEAEIEKARAAMLAFRSISGPEQAKEQYLRDQIEHCTIRAAHPGIVIYAHRKDRPDGRLDGATVREDEHFLSIVDLDQPMRGVFGVREPRVDRVAPGQPVRIVVDAFPNETFDGRVVSVNPLPEPSSYFRTKEKIYLTRVEFVDSFPGLRPGMTAEARIRISERGDALIVPDRAILRHDRKAYVAVKRDEDRYEWREVTLGKPQTIYHEVETGLEPGEFVVVDPIALLRRQTETTSSEPDPGTDGK